MFIESDMNCDLRTRSAAGGCAPRASFVDRCGAYGYKHRAPDGAQAQVRLREVLSSPKDAGGHLRITR